MRSYLPRIPLLVLSLTLSLLLLNWNAPLAVKAQGGPASITMSGQYAVRGVSPGGGTYSGSATISRYGSSYLVNWQTAQAYQGVAVRLDGILAATYGNTTCGVALYRPLSGGSLWGRWVANGESRTGGEYLIPVVPTGGIAGEYTVSGEQPDGAPYTARVHIAQTGETYRITWQKGAERTGIGVIIANYLAVAFGDQSCGVTSYTLQSDGSLSGPWAGMNDTKLGTEIFTAAGDNKSFDIVGSYRTEGRRPNGSTYRGRLRVDQRGAVFAFSWNNSQGAGIPFGDVVAATYGGDRCGVALFNRETDGTLTGYYAGVKDSRIGTEQLSPAGDNELFKIQGTYSIRGTRADNVPYQTSVTITPLGQFKRFTWESGAQGVGVQYGEQLAVAFGGSGCGVMLYTILFDGKLMGVWGGPNDVQIGSERAIR